jgi:hypothetical protein
MLNLLSFTRKGITLHQEDGAQLAFWTWEQRHEAIESMADAGLDVVPEMIETMHTRYAQLSFSEAA